MPRQTVTKLHLDNKTTTLVQLSCSKVSLVSREKSLAIQLLLSGQHADSCLWLAVTPALNQPRSGYLADPTHGRISSPAMRRWPNSRLQTRPPRTNLHLL